MKRISPIGMSYALTFLVVSSLLCGAAAADTESGIELRWALGAWSSDGDRPEAIVRDTKLEAGTRLKFMVEPTSPSSVYLFLWDTEGAIHLLYRETSLMQYDSEGAVAYIPPGSQYFEVDDAAGVDTFFLLSSAEPLTELDRLLDRYDAAADENTRVELGKEIVGEIRRQHKTHRDFAKAVEKPVMIGGQTRSASESLSDAIDRLAIEVESEGFYSKTISIDH